MFASVLFLLLGFGLNLAQAIVTGELGNATAVCDNPPSTYVAKFNGSADGTGITGNVIASGNLNGFGVDFSVELAQFPDYDTNGPFSYHIHAFPVDDTGNCSSTLGHLDPFIRGEVPGCDAAYPQTCQVGDLAGKHGTINSSDPFLASYVDVYPSLKMGLGSFFGNRSIVIHSANKTRLACANFAFDSNGTVSVGGVAAATSGIDFYLASVCGSASSTATSSAAGATSTSTTTSTVAVTTGSVSSSSATLTASTTASTTESDATTTSSSGGGAIATSTSSDASSLGLNSVGSSTLVVTFILMVMGLLHFGM